MHREWLLQKTNPEFVTYLSRTSNISDAFAQVLINRGIKRPEDISSFLECTMHDMCDPYDLDGMEDVVRTLTDARDRGTKVMVHGDYDCDGITATAIMVEALRSFGMEVSYFVPNRFDHGYGFNIYGLDHAKEAGAGLIFTVDCGITAFKTAEAAAAEGIGLIVTDHHEPQNSEDDGTLRLPVAQAIINPKLPGHPEKIRTLSGAGVAHKVTQALALKEPDRVDWERGFDLAALGTIADSVPLLDENRMLVREGLSRIISRDRLGVAALMDAAGVGPESIRSGRVQFSLVPRLNAAGRLADASLAVELMLAKSPGEAASAADSLNNLNIERQRIEEIVYKEAVACVEKKDSAPVIVVAGQGWHEGVVGIVASKLADRYDRPAFVLSITEGKAKGSARSVPGFDIHQVLTECSEHLIAYGGHKQAAGLSLKEAGLEAFEEAACLVASSLPDEPAPVLNIDAAIDLKDVSVDLVEELGRLEPFGYGNPEPVLGTRGLEVLTMRTVGRGHLKMKLKNNSRSIDAIGFGMGDLMGSINEGDMVDAAFAATINEWNDRRTLQMNLKGLRATEA